MVLTKIYLIGCLISVALSQSCLEGAESQIGLIVYKCQQGGKLEPIACSLENGQRLAIGGRAVQGSYEMECIRGPTSSLGLKPVSCVVTGRYLAPGETLTTPYFWYTCTSDGSSVSLEVSGCVDQNGHRVAMGGTFTKGPFMFRCVKQGDHVVTEAFACLSDGQQVPIGGTFIRGSYWYQCVKVGDKQIRTELKGCAMDGMRLADNAKYTKNGFVFQCKVIKRSCENCGDTASSVEHTIVGCASTDASGNSVEHPIGERWVEPGSQPQFKFVIECHKRGDQIQKQVVQCSYDGSGGSARLDPGCARKIGSNLIACIKKPDGVVEVQMLISKDTNTDQRTINNLGLTYC